MYSRRSVHSPSSELSGFGIADAVAQELGLIMLAWRSETQPRALLPLIFILAMTYYSADTDITTSRLSVCLLAGLLILNRGRVRTVLSVTPNQTDLQLGGLGSAAASKRLGRLKKKKEWHPFSVGVCLIMRGKCLWGGGAGELVAGPVFGWSLSQGLL